MTPSNLTTNIYLNINPLEYQIKIWQGKFMWKLINDEHQKPIKDKFFHKRSTSNQQSQPKQIHSALLQNYNSNFITILSRNKNME